MYDFLFFFQIVAHDNIGMFVLISVRYKYVVLFLFQTNKKMFNTYKSSYINLGLLPIQSLISHIQIPYFRFQFVLLLIRLKKGTNQKAQLLDCWAEVSVLFRTH